MEVDSYSVYVDQEKVASDMPLEYAMILAKAIFSHFFAEHSMSVTIKCEWREMTDEEKKDWN